MCKDASYPLVSVTSKGLSSLIAFSAQREDYNLSNYLSRKQAESDRVTGVDVHEKCRRDYNNRKRISSLKPGSELKKLEIETRKATENFDQLLHCFLCRKTCAQDPTHPKGSECHYASTFEIRNTILRNCRQRIEEHRYDEWALQVQRRIDCIDQYRLHRYAQIVQILWLLKCANTQPFILDFLPENHHRKLEQEKLGERRMKK